MGGPIVRTGTTPAYWENWEKAFGKGSAKKSTAAAAKKPAKSGKAKPAGKAKKKKK